MIILLIIMTVNITVFDPVWIYEFINFLFISALLTPLLEKKYPEGRDF